MKKILLLITILIVAGLSPAHSLDNSIWWDFDVLEYKYSTAYIAGQDLLNWWKSGDNYVMDVNLGGFYDIFDQKVDFEWWYYGDLTFDWYKSESCGYEDENQILYYGDNFGATKYFGSIMNLHILGWGSFDFYAQKGSELQSELFAGIGAGIGRVVNCTSVANAIMVIQELGLDASKDLVIKIANIIGKQSWYTSKYKDVWEEKYYGDIAKAMNIPNDGLKVRRVLTSNIYVINSRARGWYARAGYENCFLTGQDPAPAGFLTVSGSYQIPMGIDKQIGAGADYKMDLTNKDDSCYSGGSIYLWGSFGWDHHYTCSSYADIYYSKPLDPPSYMSDDGTIGVSVGTKKNILNNLTSHAKFSYSKTGDYDPYLSAFLEFIYHLW